jgi:hypothetical protein
MSPWRARRNNNMVPREMAAILRNKEIRMKRNVSETVRNLESKSQPRNRINCIIGGNIYLCFDGPKFGGNAESCCVWCVR